MIVEGPSYQTASSANLNIYQIRRRKVAIIVPGLMGTRLQAGNNLIWNPYGAFPLEDELAYSPLLGSLTVDFKNYLVSPLIQRDPGNFSADVSSLLDLSTALVPAGSEDSVGTESGNGNIYHRGNVITNFYGQIVDSLSRAGIQVYCFGYDWRKTFRHASANLKSMIEAAHAEHDGPTDGTRAEVYLVAHSMGGLVSRHVMRDESAKLSVEGIIFVGTPHEGAPVAYGTLKSGLPVNSVQDRILSLIHLEGRSREIALNCPGIYTLLPTDVYHGVRRRTWLQVRRPESRHQARSGRLVTPSSCDSVFGEDGLYQDTLNGFGLLDHKDLNRPSEERIKFQNSQVDFGTVQLQHNLSDAVRCRREIFDRWGQRNFFVVDGSFSETIGGYNITVGHYDPNVPSFSAASSSTGGRFAMDLEPTTLRTKGDQTVPTWSAIATWPRPKPRSGNKELTGCPHANLLSHQESIRWIKELILADPMPISRPSWYEFAPSTKRRARRRQEERCAECGVPLAEFERGEGVYIDRSDFLEGEEFREVAADDEDEMFLTGVFAHHIRTERTPHASSLNNCIVLCAVCHWRIHLGGRTGWARQPEGVGEPHLTYANMPDEDD